MSGAMLWYTIFELFLTSAILNETEWNGMEFNDRRVFSQEKEDEEFVLQRHTKLQGQRRSRDTHHQVADLPFTNRSDSKPSCMHSSVPHFGPSFIAHKARRLDIKSDSRIRASRQCRPIALLASLGR